MITRRSTTRHNRNWRLPALLALCGLFFTTPLWAEDARLSVRQQQEQIIARARADEQRAQQQAAAQRQRLSQDRQTLKQQLSELKSSVSALQQQTATLERELSGLNARRQQLEQQRQASHQQLQELLGFIRMSARDLAARIDNSPLTALQPQRDAETLLLRQPERFPAIEDLQQLRDLLLAEMKQSGEVQHRQLTLLNRQGEEETAEIVMLGPFSSAYRSSDEVGFALYSPASRRLFALSQLPDWGTRRAIAAYLDGDSAGVPIDLGLGASLRQLTFRRSLSEQLGEGGFIVWPLLLLGLVALVLICERMWYLYRHRQDGTALLEHLQPRLEQQDWIGCEQLCRADNKPLNRVLLAGLAFRDQPREQLETGLQEAILGEIPGLERFLSTLAVLAAIAPLLGLLGTVTGMIHTFQIITFHGTGDPRLMSAGISEALVTTMLGLSIAIPIMLMHSLLSRRVENRIAELEEKAISFVNRLAKIRLHAKTEAPRS
ncbi:MAG: MotA/TolQ/ExbB proton channel family protein [Desulfuromonadaceae bacterium]|nr:MotA/TolQ/ExbB proton channel family protein [Desulfuromonadaceae bacterium]